MPLRIKCPTGHVLIVPDNRVGKELRCPRCDQPFIVPPVDKKLSRQTGKVPTASPSSSSLDLGNLTASQPSTTATTQPSPPTVTPTPEIRTFPPRQPSAEKQAQAPTPKPTAPPSPPQSPAPPKKAATPKNPAPTPKPQPTTAPATAIASAPAASTLSSPPAALPTAPPPAESAPPSPLAEIPTPAPAARPPEPKQPDPTPLAIATEPQPPAPPPPEPITAPAPPVEVQISLAPRKLPVKPPPAQPPPVESVVPSVVSAAPAQVQSQPPPAVTSSLEAQAPAAANEPKHGVIHGWDKRLLVYQLAAAVIATAIFAMIPGVWDVLEYLSIPDSPYIARWAFLLLMLGLMQIGYSVYLIQLPDWSTVWVITLYSLAMAAIYAMVFGLTLITSTDGTMVSALQLQDKVAGGQAALWCLCVASLYTLLAFFAGRMSVRWHRAELVLHSVGLRPGEIPPR